MPVDDSRSLTGSRMLSSSVRGKYGGCQVCSVLTHISEYVALEKLEGLYALDPIFAQLLVHGDSTRASLVAIGVLDPERAAGLVAGVLGKKITAGDLASLETAVQDPKMRQAVLLAMGKTSRKYKMNG